MSEGWWKLPKEFVVSQCTWLYRNVQFVLKTSSPNLIHYCLFPTYIIGDKTLTETLQQVSVIKNWNALYTTSQLATIWQPQQVSHPLLMHGSDTQPSHCTLKPINATDRNHSRSWQFLLIQKYILIKSCTCNSFTNQSAIHFCKYPPKMVFITMHGRWQLSITTEKEPHNKISKSLPHPASFILSTDLSSTSPRFYICSTRCPTARMLSPSDVRCGRHKQWWKSRSHACFPAMGFVWY